MFPELLEWLEIMKCINNSGTGQNQALGEKKLKAKLYLELFSKNMEQMKSLMKQQQEVGGGGGRIFLGDFVRFKKRNV